MTTTELLAQYNAIATSAGLPTIKAWKASWAALEAKLAELVPDVTVSDIARSLNINPKIARAKLRQAGLKAVDGRWPVVQRDSPDYKTIVATLTDE